MSFDKSDKNINRQGRPKGSKNKKNALVSELISDVLENGKDRFVSELDKMKGRNYLNVYLSLLEYQLPKLARIQPNENQDIDTEFTISIVDPSEIKNND